MLVFNFWCSSLFWFEAEARICLLIDYKCKNMPIKGLSFCFLCRLVLPFCYMDRWEEICEKNQVLRITTENKQTDKPRNSVGSQTKAQDIQWRRYYSSDTASKDRENRNLELAKCLPHKHENLHLVPSTHIKSCMLLCLLLLPVQKGRDRKLIGQLAQPDQQAPGFSDRPYLKMTVTCLSAAQMVATYQVTHKNRNSERAH